MFKRVEGLFARAAAKRRNAHAKLVLRLIANLSTLRLRAEIGTNRISTPSSLAPYRFVLTPKKMEKRRSSTRSRRNVSHIHGAHRIAAAHCGRSPETVAIPGAWMHGWLPPWYARHSALLAMHKIDGGSVDEWRAAAVVERKIAYQWVARQDQADYLKLQGYEHVKAIGLPFVYLPSAPVERRPGSLLVMPPHGRNCYLAGDIEAAAYADYIASLRQHFSEIYVSITEGDYVHGAWWTAFQRRKLQILMGCNPFNQDPLLHVRDLISQFEYVTTNSFGSHIVYAAACGAKVSIAGPYAEFPQHELARAYAPKMYPELLDTVSELLSEASTRRHCPFLFCEPQRAVPHKADFEIGVQHRQSPADLARLFCWDALQQCHLVRAALAAVLIQLSGYPLVDFALDAADACQDVLW